MRNLLIGLGLILLALGAYLYFNNKPEGTVAPQAIAFAAEDVSLITKVTMQSRGGEAIELKKSNDQWIVNGEYPAFQPFMDVFLGETLAKIKVKGPAPDAARENVIREMVASAIKVDIYHEDKLVQSYYVGGPTPDLKGTYVHMKGSDKPYIAYIPGFEGFITPKFNLVEREWLDRSVFDLRAEEISSIHMINNEDPSKSYSIERTSSGFQMTPVVSGFSQQAAKSYFALFSFKNFEGYPDYLTAQAQDSVIASTPLQILRVETLDGKSQVLRVYRKAKQGINTLTDRSGNFITYDPERYFATFSGFDKLVTIQEYTFGQILAHPGEFTE